MFRLYSTWIQKFPVARQLVPEFDKTTRRNGTLQWYGPCLNSSGDNLESQVILNYGEHIYEILVEKEQQKFVLRILRTCVFNAYKCIAVKVSTLQIQRCKSHKLFFTIFRETRGI
jgi:hypothetical protein